MLIFDEVFKSLDFKYRLRECGFEIGDWGSCLRQINGRLCLVANLQSHDLQSVTFCLFRAPLRLPLLFDISPPLFNFLESPELARYKKDETII